MESWRRQKWDNHKQELPRRSQYKKPPRGSWQPTVPSWEKEFCKVVGTLDWETILQMKKYAHLYENVLKWNDSAGEEAFHDAKKRFWAKKQGLLCDISLPDPNLYIDDINWDSETDPELLLDLECKCVVLDAGENHEPVVIFGDSLLANQAFSSAGWGDRETGWGDKLEDFKIPANESAANHGNLQEQNSSNDFHAGNTNGCVNAHESTWRVRDGNEAIRNMSLEGGRNDIWGWNHANGHYNYGVESKNFRDKKADYARESWDVNNPGRANAGRYLSRYKSSRVQGNEHYTDLAWRKV